MYGRPVLTVALVALLHAPGALAQPAERESAEAAPAHVAYVEGAVTLERDGRPETAPLNMPLLSGDRLKTLDGRVEVLFGDGSALHLDARTTMDVQSDELVRLLDGRLRLSIAGGTDRNRLEGITYRVDSPSGSVRITQPGEYRVAILRRGEEIQLELAVLRGAGEIFTDEGATAVRAGERAYASTGLAPSYAYTYNSANWDAFDRWSESRRDTRLGVSAQYLPSEVRAYASTFDEDGDWRYETSYGYVWYPRVAVSWRPYYYGRWAQYPRYGWTWIGADRFAWPTHHYGRWGFSAGAWFWIPANRWAPAHVSWAYAPGYVSWCPLGFDNRPVIGINIFNVRPGYYSSWRAWTSVGDTHFGRGYVHQRAVQWDRVDRTRYPSFAVARSAPVSREIAVPRSTPIRRAGASGTRSAAGHTSSPWRAPAESGAASPRYTNRGDEIVRSQTARPSAIPRNAGERTWTTQGRTSTTTQGVPSNIEGRTSTTTRGIPANAAGRATPAGPARRVESMNVPPAPSPIDRSGGIAVPRPGYIPRPPYERGGAAPRADAPVYQPGPRTYPRYDGGQAPSRTAPPNVAVPRADPVAPPPPDPGSRGVSPRGGFESRPYSPGGGGERQAPAPRATPGPEGASPRGTAVPRGSGGPGAAGAAARPAGGGTGTRSPGGRGGR